MSKKNFNGFDNEEQYLSVRRFVEHVCDGWKLDSFDVSYSVNTINVDFKYKNLTASLKLNGHSFHSTFDTDGVPIDNALDIFDFTDKLYHANFQDIFNMFIYANPGIDYDATEFNDEFVSEEEMKIEKDMVQKKMDELKLKKS